VGTGGETLALARCQEAERLCREDAYEEIAPREAIGLVDSMDRRLLWPLREFVANAHLTSFSLSEIDDQQLLELVRRGIRARRVLVLRPGSGRQRAPDVTAERRRLIRQIEAQTRGRLAYAGRQYRLVADRDMGSVPGRQTYEVVCRDDAVQVLAGLAQQSAGDLPNLLLRASETLTSDWRPPFQPDGLILLRRIPVMAADEPAITPSQLKQLLKKTDWIEIEVVYEDGKPYTGHYRLELPDDSVADGALDAEGFYGNYDITPGTCKFSLVAEAAASAAAVSPTGAEPGASVPAATPSDATPSKLRFRLLDLLGDPISGAEVTVAGATRTSDGDGMVEVDASQGAGSVLATLPGGDVALNVGGLKPADLDGDAGWRTRLFNMGFLWDPAATEGDDEMMIALQDFQAQYQIDVSGQLDDATKAKLVESYGC
jgi:hypothetical protein